MKVVLRGEIMNICINLILLERFVCAYASIYNTEWETYVINNVLCTPENSKKTPLEGKSFHFLSSFL